MQCMVEYQLARAAPGEPIEPAMLEVSMGEFGDLYNHLFATDVSDKDLEGPQSVESAIKTALGIIENYETHLNSETFKSQDHELIDKAERLRKILNMSNDLSCKSESLFERTLISLDHENFPRIKQYLDFHKTRQLDQCRERLDDAIRLATNEFKANEPRLIDSIRSNVSNNLKHLRGREKALTFNNLYVTKTIQSIENLITSKNYVHSLRRRPGQLVDDYKDDFADKVLDIFEDDCRPIEEMGLHDLVREYQKYHDKLMNLNAESLLNKLNDKSLDWLQRGLICKTIEQKIAELLVSFITRVYNPVQLLEELRKEPTKGADQVISTPLLNPDEVQNELIFIKFVADHVAPNDGRMARLNYQLDHYIALMKPSNLVDCDTDKIYELNRLKELDSKSSQLVGFHTSRQSAYLLNCFNIIDRNTIQKIPGSSLANANVLRRSVKDLTDRDVFAESVLFNPTSLDNIIIEAIINFLKVYLNSQQELTKNQLTKIYQNDITKHCLDYRTHLGPLWDDLIEMPAKIKHIEHYYTRDLRNSQSTIKICDRILNNPKIFEGVTKKLGHKCKSPKSKGLNLNLVCFGRSSST